MPLSDLFNVLGIAWLPRRADGKQQGITVEDLNFGHCCQWDRDVQPHIDNLQEVRADKGWNWRLIYLLKLLGNSKNKSAGAAVISFDESGRRLIHALVLYFFPVNAPRLYGDQSVYVAYWVSAPTSTNESQSLRYAGRAAMDHALVTAVRNTRGGLWLHAAPKGSIELLTYYEKLGFSRISIGETIAPPHKLIRKKNDGRLLYSGPDTTEKLIREMDLYRRLSHVSTG